MTFYPLAEKGDRLFLKNFAANLYKSVHLWYNTDKQDPCNTLFVRRRKI